MVRLLTTEEEKNIYSDNMSLIGYIECSINELIEKIGEPQINRPNTNENTHYEWKCAIVNETDNSLIPFTLYDYKDNIKELDPNEMFEFHIGGNNKHIHIIRKTLRDLIFA